MIFTMRKITRLVWVSMAVDVFRFETTANPGGSSTGAGEREGGVQSLNRALCLLDTLAENDEGLSLTGLAKAVSLPPSSAHRLLTTLQRKHFVRFDPATMTWRVGVQAFVVGNSFARSREVAPIAMPYMRHLREKTGETVNLYVPNGAQAICIAQVQSQQTIRAISRPGGGVPLHRSAAGKTILARMSNEEVDEWLDAHVGTIGATARRKLHADLGRIRKRGYALDDEEVACGLRCIATAIVDEHGAGHGALSIAGPITRLTDERLDQLAEFVVGAGEAVTRSFGGGHRTVATNTQARASEERTPSRRLKQRGKGAL
jgi:IclR family acetate operon transcriptional repressor